MVSCGGIITELNNFAKTYYRKIQKDDKIMYKNLETQKHTIQRLVDIHDNILDELNDLPSNRRKTILSALTVLTDNKKYREAMLDDIKNYNIESDKWKIYHPMISNNKIIQTRQRNIFNQYENCNFNKEWATATNYSCWWCCHKFQTPPCFIPLDYKNDIFYVYGNFCSFNCALSYNFEKQSIRKIQTHLAVSHLRI